jgi:hypothetical protein
MMLLTYKDLPEEAALRFLHMPWLLVQSDPTMLAQRGDPDSTRNGHISATRIIWEENLLACEEILGFSEIGTTSYFLSVHVSTDNESQ